MTMKKEIHNILIHFSMYRCTRKKLNESKYYLSFVSLFFLISQEDRERELFITNISHSK